MSSQRTMIAFPLFLLVLLFELVLSKYAESIIIDVDVSIKVLPQLMEQAHTHIQDIVQDSFEHTNQDDPYLIDVLIQDIQHISNFTYACTDGSSFRYHTMMNVDFKSETEYINAIEKYQTIFSNDPSNFIHLYETNIEKQLLLTLNTDSLSSQAVIINSFDMLQGTLITHYKKAFTKTLVTTDINSENVSNTDLTTTNTFIKDNLILLTAFGAILMTICFCLTMFCFWNGQQKQTLQRKQSRQHSRMWSMEKVKFEHENIAQTTQKNCAITAFGISVNNISAKDPFQWSKSEVVSHLKNSGLFVKYCPNINGQELLTKYKQFCIETDDTHKLDKAIERLRLESPDYDLWKLEQTQMDIYTNTSTDSQDREGNGSDVNTVVRKLKTKKKIRKPPRKLRRKASIKKRDETDETVSVSSTEEIAMPMRRRNKSVDSIIKILNEHNSDSNQRRHRRYKSQQIRTKKKQVRKHNRSRHVRNKSVNRYDSRTDTTDTTEGTLTEEGTDTTDNETLGTSDTHSVYQ